MADTAFQRQYRDEFIAGFEQRQSFLRNTVTTQGEVRGNEFVFLVADSGDATAVTRGTNGLIPARADNLNQYTATLAEWHDLVHRTRFNLYASQGDGRRIMQESTMAVLNRRVDADILSALANATLSTTTTGVTMSLNLAVHAQTILGNNAVPIGSGISCIISPAAYGYLLQTKEFTNVEYVGSKPFEVTDQPTAFRWAGINWIVHPNVPGKGTATETLYMYHRSAVGHGCDMETIGTAADYVAEHDYSWARATAYMGSKLLQTKGVVKILHDGSAFASAT